MLAAFLKFITASPKLQTTCGRHPTGHACSNEIKIPAVPLPLKPLNAQQHRYSR